MKERFCIRHNMDKVYVTSELDEASGCKLEYYICPECEKLDKILSFVIIALVSVVIFCIWWSNGR